VDTSTGALLVRAVLDNKDQAVLPGLFARVRTPIAQQNTALLMRDDAIGTSQEGKYVLAVGPDNIVRRKVVETGQREGRLRIIVSGLDPADLVVVEGIQRAFPGAKVDPQRIDLTSAAADPSDAAKPGVADPSPK
jgi:membrane fusion protein, multidrug efflux system